MKQFLTGVGILLFFFTGCPQPPTEADIFADIQVADFFVFAEGDSAASVTQPFTFQTEKNGVKISVKAPSSMTVTGNTVSVNWYNVYTPAQEAVLTATLTKDGQSKTVPYSVVLKRSLGSMPVSELILFNEELDTVDAVTSNFTLSPTTGAYGETVTYTVSPDSKNIVYDESTGLVTVTLTDSRQSATVTATFTKEGFEPVTKTYELTILTSAEGYSWTPDSLTDYITLGNGGKDYLWRIRDNFTLQTSFEAEAGHDAGTITWTSSNEAAISVSGGTATVTRDLDSQKVTLTAAFAETGRRPKEIKIDVLVMETIPATLTVDGKTYKLVYFDAFDNQAILEANWDNGNPGYDKYSDKGQLLGNPGGEPFYYKSPDGQFHGYGNELHKQPTWSPRATEIKDGKARLHIKYDSEISQGIIGAIHSYRRFPHGLFIARWTEKRDNTNHWDAFWLDTNHPFSKAYGQKILNLPKALRSQVTQDSELGEGFFDNTTGNIQKGNDTVVNPILYQAKYTMIEDTSTQDDWQFTKAISSGQKGRFYNAEQRYELDAFELAYENNNPWVVIHQWGFMRGNPSNNPSAGWRSVGAVARGIDQLDPSPNGKQFNTSHIANKTPFTFSCLYNEEKIAFYHSGSGQPEFTNCPYSRTKTTSGLVEGSQMPWPDDEFNPVEIKFSIEPGSGWGDNPAASEGDWYKQGNVDYMDVEYFAYYAAEDDMLNPNIGDANGVALTAITDMDNVLESAETQAKLTKEWVQK